MKICLVRIIQQIVLIRRYLLRRYLLGLYFSLQLFGCSNPFGGTHSEIDPGHQPGVVKKLLPPAKGAEFVSSSQQSAKTYSGKYFVSGSLASPTDQLYKQLASGKKIYFNLQGELISQDQVKP